MGNNTGDGSPEKNMKAAAVNWMKHNPVQTAIAGIAALIVIFCIILMVSKGEKMELPVPEVAPSKPEQTVIPELPSVAETAGTENALPEVHVVYLAEGVHLKLIKINANSEVSIADEYYIGAFEVTQSQYKTVMNENPSVFQGKNLPVENVSWDMVMMFCDKLTADGHALAGWKFTLPSSEQWEFACRAGTKTQFSCGDTLNVKDANFSKTRFRKTVIVGSFPANAFGLYDMHGNVWEWCSNAVPAKKGTTGKMREVRGGSWWHGESFCRSSTRGRANQLKGDSTIGFRIAMVKAD